MAALFFQKFREHAVCMSFISLFSNFASVNCNWVCSFSLKLVFGSSIVSCLKMLMNKRNLMKNCGKWINEGIEDSRKGPSNLIPRIFGSWLLHGHCRVMLPKWIYDRACK